MDGLSHWLCIPETHESVKYGACLLSFDWSKEVFIITPTPSNAVDYFPNFSDLSSHLVLLNGSIALAVVYRATTTIHISILGELSVKESWTKIFVVGPLPCLEHPIGAGKKGWYVVQKERRRTMVRLKYPNDGGPWCYKQRISLSNSNSLRKHSSIWSKKYWFFFSSLIFNPRGIWFCLLGF